MPLPFLAHFGLSETESSLYELLLRLGTSPAWVIVKESKLKRPTVYKHLASLEEKGLIKSADKGKIAHFTPAPPTELLTIAENRYESLTRAKNDLQSILPSLLSSYTLAVEKPVLRTFEGVEGLKQIYDDQVAVGKPIYALQNTEVVEPTLFKWLTTVHVRQRVKAGIPAKVIASAVDWAKEYAKLDEKELRTTRIVPSDLYPIQHGVDIYGDKVAFINYKKDEALIGVVITHPSIAKTMKAFFDLAWNGANL